MSYKHLVYTSQSDFALLAQDAAGSLSLRDPLSPPATFPQHNLTHSPASACNVHFPQLIEKPYICSYEQIYFSFLQVLQKSTLAGPNRLVLQVKITEESSKQPQTRPCLRVEYWLPFNTVFQPVVPSCSHRFP